MAAAPTTAEAAARWLPRVAVAETATVVLLLGNLATVHAEAVASLVGPLHGTAYLATVACAWLAGLTRRARLLSVTPVVGGFLALRVDRRRP